MADKFCRTCEYFYQDFCLATVREHNRVTGQHKYYTCESVRTRKPRWPGYNGNWCGEAGRLWKAKGDVNKNKEQMIAELLMEKAGFSDADAFALAKDIMELI